MGFRGVLVIKIIHSNFLITTVKATSVYRPISSLSNLAFIARTQRPPNLPDADFPDELNWLRDGHNYGFPWRFGDQDNPQQFPDYNSKSDKRLSSDFFAVKSGLYRTDPTSPKSPGCRFSR